MQLTSFGHSCLLVEVAEQRLLIDPGAFSPGWEDLTDLDAVFVTHRHPDHLDVDRLPRLLERNGAARVIVESQTADQLADSGIDVARLMPGESVQVGGAGGVGGVTVEPVGQRHAVIHADIPRIDNTGLVLRADGEPILFHPGDALDADPGQVDVCCVPVNAPWCAMKETVDFVRRIAAPTMVPIHDALLSDTGRELYLRQVGNLAAQSHDLRIEDLRGRKAVTLR